MTTVFPAPPRPAIGLTWIQVERDLWTASTTGDFRGTVHRVAPGRFTAMDGLGQALGEYADLASAKESVQRGSVSVSYAA